MKLHKKNWWLGYLLAMLITGLSATSSTLGQDNLLVYAAEVDGNRDIYAMNPDGTNVMRLTTHPAEDIDPAWSPDRRRIAFLSNRDGDGFALYVMDANGGNQRRLSPPTTGAFAYRYSPNWSPDGQSIIFVMEEGISTQLYTISVNGGNERRLQVRENAEYPAWSPNGELAYVAPGPQMNVEIFLMDTRGNSQQLTNEANVNHRLPAWSPDGSQLAYVSVTQGLHEIYVMDWPSRQSFMLTSLSNSSIYSLAWSLDGTEIAYTDRDGKLTIIAIDTYATRVLNDETVRILSVTWSATQSSFGSIGSSVYSADGLVQYGQTLQGRLQRGARDRWAFRGMSGDQVVIDLRSQQFDPLLELLDESGRVVASNDDFDGLNSRITFVLPSTGTYTIIARAYNNSGEGAYSLSLSQGNLSSSSQYTHYINGVITTGRLNVRRNPSPDAIILHRISQGDVVRVIGRNSDSSWVMIDTGVVGWVNASYVDSFGDVYRLPVYNFYSQLPASQMLPINITCEGARGPSFRINDRFVVPFGDGPTIVFNEPNRRPELARIPEGRGGVILAGPICTRARRGLGRLLFWYVRTDSGVEGYVSEGYLEDPIPWIAPQR